jgi:hypothetical protein
MTLAASSRAWLDPRLEAFPLEILALEAVSLGDVWQAWSAIAAGEELDAGDLSNLRAIAYRVAGAEVASIAVADLVALLDELEADARSRRPMYAVETLGDGRVALVADPRGRLNNEAAALVDLRASARASRDRYLASRLAELRRQPGRPGLEAVTPRLGLSVATAKRLKSREK